MVKPEGNKPSHDAPQGDSDEHPDDVLELEIHDS
jgi:hypothetical protein